MAISAPAEKLWGPALKNHESDLGRARSTPRQALHHRNVENVGARTVSLSTRAMFEPKLNGLVAGVMIVAAIEPGRLLALKLGGRFFEKALIPSCNLR